MLTSIVALSGARNPDRLCVSQYWRLFHLENFSDFENDSFFDKT